MGNKKQFQHLKIEFIHNIQERKKQRHRRKNRAKTDIIYRFRLDHLNSSNEAFL